LLMLPVIKYFWPLWIGLILQFFTAFAGELLLGENSAFVDWVFSRNCNQGLACGGNRWLLSMWSMVAVLTVINAIVWGITDLVRKYRDAPTDPPKNSSARPFLSRTMKQALFVSST